MFHTIYRDRDLLVLEKPSGLLAVPGRGPDLQDCLSTRVQSAIPEALVVHRLDRDTSGLMIMALSPEAQRALSRQFEARTVDKQYEAIVSGCPAEPAGTIDLPMRKDFARPPRHRIDHEQGRPALTNWRVIERLTDRGRLEISPRTGRSHQIRLHLATIGHPVLGDPLYAHEQALQMSKRLLLHATRLTITHPSSGATMVWTSECPF